MQNYTAVKGPLEEIPEPDTWVPRLKIIIIKKQKSLKCHLAALVDDVS